MIYQKFSKRQLLAMSWWARPKLKHYDALICDGSVRSGKTVCMANGFLLWSMSNFNGQNFGICGKTIQSLRRNVILNLTDWMGGILTIEERRSENKLIISDGRGHTNNCFLFGGRDESSYMLIQGITLAGVLMDEVALMPRSFVEQVCARCSVEGSRLWFSCNPDGPSHWFYQEWVQKATEKGVLRLTFTMRDNPGLSPAVLERYERLFQGTFYRRFVLGEWVAAEGLVYDFFTPDMARPVPPDVTGPWYISCDYGTVNPTSMGLWGKKGDVWYRVAEFYYDSRKEHRQKTDQEYAQDLKALAGGRTEDPGRGGGPLRRQLSGGAAPGGAPCAEG